MAICSYDLPPPPSLWFQPAVGAGLTGSCLPPTSWEKFFPPGSGEHPVSEPRALPQQSPCCSLPADEQRHPSAPRAQAAPAPAHGPPLPAEAQRRPYYADYSPTRRSIHSLCTSHYLDLFITFIIGLNVITMSMEHYNQPKVGLSTRDARPACLQDGLRGHKLRRALGGVWHSAGWPGSELGDPGSAAWSEPSLGFTGYVEARFEQSNLFFFKTGGTPRAPWPGEPSPQWFGLETLAAGTSVRSAAQEQAGLEAGRWKVVRVVSCSPCICTPTVFWRRDALVPPQRKGVVSAGSGVAPPRAVGGGQVPPTEGSEHHQVPPGRSLQAWHGAACSREAGRALRAAPAA